jgi:hypothetical protein
MITGGIILFFSSILLGLLSPLFLLTDVASNSSIVAAIVVANGYISAVPFPYFVLSLLSSLSFLVVFEAAYGTYKVVRWVYKKIPGVS